MDGLETSPLGSPDTGQVEKMNRFRQKLFDELTATEKTYLDHLDLIIKVFESMVLKY